MLDLTKLWDVNYLFGSVTPGLVRSDYFFAGLAGVLVLLAIVSKFLTMKEKKDNPKRFLFGRLYHLGLTIGILLALWFGARFESIPWLSTHFLALFISLVFLVWLGFIVKYYIREYPGKQTLWQEEQVKRKYLS